MRNEIFTRKGAAFILGVPLSRLSYYTKKGLLTPCKYGSKYYYKVSDIEAFASKRKGRN